MRVNICADIFPGGRFILLVFHFFPDIWKWIKMIDIFWKICVIFLIYVKFSIISFFVISSHPVCLFDSIFITFAINKSLIRILSEVSARNRWTSLWNRRKEADFPVFFCSFIIILSLDNFKEGNSNFSYIYIYISPLFFSKTFLQVDGRGGGLNTRVPINRVYIQIFHFYILRFNIV